MVYGWSSYFINDFTAINLQNNMVYEDIEDETHKKQNRIKIENGEIIDGVFDKSLLGAKAQGLFM